MSDYKALLLDFDGVLSPGKLFSEIYSEEFGVPIAEMMPLFDEFSSTVTLGKGDLKDIIEKHIPNWKWKGTVDEFIEYWMNADSDVDENVVALGKKFKDKYGEVYLATDQEKYRAEFIWNNRGLRDWMDGRFVSFELGVSKNNPEFFEKVLKILNADPSEIIYFDDSQTKVDSADSVGIRAILYRTIEDILSEINL